MAGVVGQHRRALIVGEHPDPVPAAPATPGFRVAVAAGDQHSPGRCGRQASHPAATLGCRRTSTGQDGGFVGVVDDEQPRFCSGEQALPDHVRGVSVSQFGVGDAAAAAERAHAGQEPALSGGWHPPDLGAILIGAVGDLECEPGLPAAAEAMQQVNRGGRVGVAEFFEHAVAAANGQVVVSQAERRRERNGGFRVLVAFARNRWSARLAPEGPAWRGRMRNRPGLRQGSGRRRGQLWLPGSRCPPKVTFCTPCPITACWAWPYAVACCTIGPAELAACACISPISDLSSPTAFGRASSRSRSRVRHTISCSARARSRSVPTRPSSAARDSSSRPCAA